MQTRAVTLAAAELWDEDRDDNAHERLFIEAVCAFVGITPLPGVRVLDELRARRDKLDLTIRTLEFRAGGPKTRDRERVMTALSIVKTKPRDGFLHFGGGR